MTLAAFIADGARQPWRWGFHDCCAFPARWAGIALPPYGSLLEASRMVADAGGTLLAVIERHLPALFAAVEQPQAGDIGVIDVLDRVTGDWMQVGAIFIGPRWAFAANAGGIACVHADPVRIWSAR